MSSQKSQTEISSEDSHIPHWKLEEVKDIVNLFKKYNNVAVINVSGINDRQIQETRKFLRNEAVLKMSKKNLQIRAIEKYQKESKKESLDEFKEKIPGQSSLLFTNMNVFEIKRIFEEKKWMIPPKPEAETPVDIIVPAGDTGLPTGQVISELNMTLKLPTKIQNDTIWVREDKKTHKAGEFVSVKQAAVLKKLGIKPLESLIKIHVAWCDGDILPREVIYMDLDKFQEEFENAYATARALAIGLNVIDKDTIDSLILKAHREALALLFEMPIFAEKMLDDYVAKAEMNTNLINTLIFGSGVQAPVAQAMDTKEKKEEKEEDEKEDEEMDEVSGIGSLF